MASSSASHGPTRFFLGLGLLLAAVTASSSHGQQPAATEADDLVALTNVDRTSNGVPALLVDDRLMGVAQERSNDMVARGYFSHSIPPDGRTFIDLLKERGISYLAAGENLAYNTAGEATSAELARAELMDSPTHRSLILDAAFNHLGAGAAVGEEPSRRVYTMLFARMEAGTGLARPAPTPRPSPPAATSAPVIVASPTPGGIGRVRRPSDPRAMPGVVEYVMQRVVRSYMGL